MALIRNPFKSKDGFDANMNRIQNVSAATEDNDAIIKSTFDEEAEYLRSGNIYVRNITSNESGTTVTNTYQNGIFLVSSITAASDVNLNVFFERGNEQTLIPKIHYTYSATDTVPTTGWTEIMTDGEINGIDLTQSSVATSRGVLNILDDKDLFIFDLNITTLQEGFYFFKNNAKVYVLEIQSVVLPVVTLGNYTGSYPGTQSELANDATIEFTVVSDKYIYGVEVNGTYITHETLVKTGDNLSEVIPITIENAPSTNDTPLHAYVSIRVKDEYGNWSAWYSSDTDLVGDINLTHYVNVNDISPTFTNIAIAYPSGHTALDTGETATITYDLTYLGDGDIVGANLDSSLQGTPTVSTTQATVIGNAGSYRYNTNTLELTATRTNNGKVTVNNIQVNVASTSATVQSISANQFRSSVSGEITNFNVVTNQELSAHTIVMQGTTTGISIVNNGAISGTNINNAQISITDAVTKGTYVITVEVTNTAGKVTTQTFNVQNIGFIERITTSNNITAPIAIPEIVNPSNVIVWVGNTTNLVSTSIFTTSPTGTYLPSFTGTSTELDEFQVYINSGTWYIVFDENILGKASAGGWSTNARIKIEETI